MTIAQAQLRVGMRGNYVNKRRRALAFESMEIGLVLLVAMVLPIAGLWMSSKASQRLEDIVEARDVANGIDQSVTDATVVLRAYENSGTTPATRDAGGLALAKGGNAGLVRTLANARTIWVPTEVRGLLMNMVSVGEGYAVIIARQIESLSMSEGDPALARQGTVARAASLQASVDFSTAARQVSDEAISASTSARQVSLGLAIAAVVFVALCVGSFAALQAVGNRKRLAVAEQTAEARTQMVSLASHELRNPLAIVSLSAQMLEIEAEATGNVDFIQMAHDTRTAAARADGLVAELLDLSRIDAGRLHLRLEPVNLSALLDPAIDATRLHRGPRKFECRGLDSDLQVLADPARVSIILRNLVDNAVKYSPEGSTVLVEVRSNTGAVTVDVIDQGPGVAEDEHERIFERFQRSERTLHIDGVGIGLYLSRELARRMKGDLKVIPTSAGAQFRLSLVSHTGVSTVRETALV